MATQKCKDCGNQVSTRAKQCPHCGAPVGRKSGCLGAILLLFFVFVVIVIISSSIDETPSAAVAKPAPTQTSPPQVSQGRTPSVPKPTPETPSKPEPPTESAAPDWEARGAELYAQFLREFVAPAVGSPITVKLTQGKTMQGIVKNLTQEEIQIESGPAMLGFAKSQLSMDSRLRCFATDYAKSKADAQIDRERSQFEAQRKADRERRLADQRRRDEEDRRRVELSAARERVSKAQLVLFNCTWSSAHGFVTVEGQVGNISGQKLQNVEALAQFYTADKTFITSDSALLEYNPLMPGQVSPFKVMATHNPMMKSASVSFKLMWGDALDYVSKEDYDKAKP
jgi:hypothetical protein